MWSFLLFGGFNVLAASVDVAVIIDDDLPLYHKVVRGIELKLKHNFLQYSLSGDSSRGAQVLASALANNPKAIISVGPKSTNAAKKATAEKIPLGIKNRTVQFGKVPVIYCLVPRPENYDLDRKRMVGIRLEHSYQVQLRTLTTLISKIRRVGVVYNPIKSTPTFREANNAAKSLGLELVGVEVLDPSDTEAALNNVKENLDALWMLSDPISLNLRAADATIQYSFKKKIPFFAVNDGFVARGALLSFVLDYIHIGEQAGKLADQIVDKKLSPSEIDVVAPEGLNLAVNVASFKKIDGVSNMLVRLLAYAAEMRYKIFPYS